MTDKSMKLQRILVCFLLLFHGFFVQAYQSELVTNYDQLPMYGGLNRDSIPELRAADETFVKAAVKAFGSREIASIRLVDSGFSYYRNDDLEKAMRRVNQAWLLNGKNPDVYWGFAAILKDRKHYCVAMDMIDKSLALNPPAFQGFYPDAGLIITLCAANNAAFPLAEKSRLFRKSESLYQQAEFSEPNKKYLYESWAHACYWQERYSDAWEMVAKVEALGGNVDKKMLEKLRVHTMDPRQSE